MTQYIGAVPAYGRDYKSQAAVKADWAAGKDFRISDVTHPDYGRYINKADLPKGATMMIRYARLTKIVAIK